ncbi:MAG: hypothetical protein AB7P00_38725, partial [Sandaracinaceae bacterium]
RGVHALREPPERDFGLGTLYERWAIYRLLDRWGRGATTALEGPIDGMAGMEGLHLMGLCHLGAHVTCVQPDAAARDRVRTAYAAGAISDRLTVREDLPKEAAFDLVLSFNAPPYADDWRGYLGELARRSRRWLIVFVTHPYSYGTWIRRGLRRVEGGLRERELFDHEACRPAVMEAELRRHGTIEAQAFVDCPWWPDLFVRPGQTLLSATWGRLGRTVSPARSAYTFGPSDFPFARGALEPDLARALARHPGFDGTRLAGVFAHHRAYRVRVGPVDRARDGRYA